MHEIGHMLGFGHYFSPTGAPFCSNALDGIMKRNTNPGTNITELSLHDKCMFAKLYCPDLTTVSIYDYQPRKDFPKVYAYPNPSDDLVNVVFDLPRTSDVKLTVKNVLGETLLIPIENKLYGAGEHSLQINTNILPVGTYYIVIQAGLQKTSQPIVIAR